MKSVLGRHGSPSESQHSPKESRASNPLNGRRFRTALRTGLMISGTALAVAVLWIMGVTWLIITPPQAPGDRHADAIVSLSPSYERLPLSVELYESGAAENLVVSWFPNLYWAIANSSEPALAQRFCGQPSPTIFCFTPARDSTIGEALEVRAIVEAHNWRSVTVVTHQSHAFRAKYIFQSCLGPDVDVEVRSVGDPPRYDAWIRRVAYENAAFVKALIETRTLCG